MSGCNEKGFSLLEALVALVIMAGIGMALYGWINTNLISFSRVQEADERSAAVRMAMDLIRTVNPMARPEGSEDVPPYRVSWSATPVEEPHQGVSSSGGRGLHRVGLYELDVVVSRRGIEITRFLLRQVGYEQTRSNLPK